MLYWIEWLLYKNVLCFVCFSLSPSLLHSRKRACPTRKYQKEFILKHSGKVSDIAITDFKIAWLLDYLSLSELGIRAQVFVVKLHYLKTDSIYLKKSYSQLIDLQRLIKLTNCKLEIDIAYFLILFRNLISIIII